MQVPYRVAAIRRWAVSPGVTLAFAFSTFTFSATPFLIELVVEEYEVGLTSASLISVVQLAGFGAGSWFAGRWLHPSSVVFCSTIAIAVAVNALSVLLPPYLVLLSLRVASGLTLGVIAWFGWSQVFGDRKGTADVAVVGPVAGMLASPIIAIAASRGIAAVFGVTAIAATLPLLFVRSTGAEDRIPDASSRSHAVPVARLLLLLLGLFTFGGSAVFQYAVVIGSDELALRPATIAWVLSANAMIGIPATRWPWGRGTPGLWIALTGVCAVVVAGAFATWAYCAAILVWGFAFWMGVPGVFDLLAERSRHPSDRAGDAQAVMALGRVIGPFVGGAVLESAGSIALGVVGGSAMIVAGVGIFAVRLWAPPHTPSVWAESQGVGSSRPR